MALSYTAGRAKVLDIAQQQRSCKARPVDYTPLYDAVGRIAAEDVICPRSNPEHDTSAMDGYAVRSLETAAASEHMPVLLKVQGTIAAGDDPIMIVKALGLSDKDRDTNTNLCVEIMTGAIFPKGYDACVKVEDTVLVEGPTGRHILIKKPVAHNANRRFAGSDMLEGDVILKRGEAVQSSHILPLASVGLESVPVVQQPRVGIWSTGAEMLNGNGATRDANGPYLTAAAREMGLRVDFLGVLQDDPATLHQHLRKAADSGAYDVLITSGAVSKGRFDHVRGVLDEMGAGIVFHGLTIRPGHPVLFALPPGTQRRTAFFGLPGNPGAAAACFRSLTVPYLRELQGQPLEQPLLARLTRQTRHLHNQAHLPLDAGHGLFPPRRPVNLGHRPLGRRAKRGPKPGKTRPLHHSQLLDPFPPRPRPPPRARRRPNG